MVETISSNTQYLQERLQEVKDKQGFLGKAWNGVKETTGLGLSQSDCDSMVEKFNNGEISFEEATAYIDDYEKKQSGASDLIANIATGVGAIAVATTAAAATVATGGAAAPAAISWGLAIAKGAPIGAALKAGIKTLDRATNDVEGDALDARKIAKDAISGSVTGATSAVSSGVGAGIKAGKFGLSVLNGTKCSTICGAASGATSYLANCAFDEDKDFDLGELFTDTATSAFISGTVGAAVGGGLYGIQSLAGNVGKETLKSTTETIISDSATSSTRKILSNAERNIIAA